MVKAICCIMGASFDPMSPGEAVWIAIVQSVSEVVGFVEFYCEQYGAQPQLKSCVDTNACKWTRFRTGAGRESHLSPVQYD